MLARDVSRTVAARRCGSPHQIILKVRTDIDGVEGAPEHVKFGAEERAILREVRQVNHKLCLEHRLVVRADGGATMAVGSGAVCTHHTRGVAANKRISRFELLSIRLSRACLGQTTSFIHSIKWHRKRDVVFAAHRFSRM